MNTIHSNYQLATVSRYLSVFWHFKWLDRWQTASGDEFNYTSTLGSDPWSPRRFSLSSFLRLAGWVLVCHTRTWSDVRHTIRRTNTVRLLCIKTHMQRQQWCRQDPHFKTNTNMLETKNKNLRQRPRAWDQDQELETKTKRLRQRPRAWDQDQELETKTKRLRQRPRAWDQDQETETEAIPFQICKQNPRKLSQ